ncbi:MAG: hypothetical protein ACLQF1_12275 [Methyloceanibacter sp.]
MAKSGGPCATIPPVTAEIVLIALLLSFLILLRRWEFINSATFKASDFCSRAISCRAANGAEMAAYDPNQT